MKKGQFAIIVALILAIGIGIACLVYVKLDNVEKNKMEEKDNNNNESGQNSILKPVSISEIQKYLDLIPETAYSGKLESYIEHKNEGSTGYSVVDGFHYSQTFTVNKKENNSELILEEKTLIIHSTEEGNIIVRKTFDGEKVAQINVKHSVGKAIIIDNDKTYEINNNDYDSTLKNILSKYENQANTFRHTFKKNSNGEYYWYSTEKIN